MGMIHLRKGVIPVYEMDVIPLHGSDTPLYEEIYLYMEEIRHYMRGQRV